MPYHSSMNAMSLSSVNSSTGASSRIAYLKRTEGSISIADAVVLGPLTDVCLTGAALSMLTPVFEVLSEPGLMEMFSMKTGPDFLDGAVLTCCSDGAEAFLMVLQLAASAEMPIKISRRLTKVVFNRNIGKPQDRNKFANMKMS